MSVESETERLADAIVSLSREVEEAKEEIVAAILAHAAILNDRAPEDIEKAFETIKKQVRGY